MRTTSRTSERGPAQTASQVAVAGIPAAIIAWRIDVCGVGRISVNVRVTGKATYHERIIDFFANPRMFFNEIREVEAIPTMDCPSRFTDLGSFSWSISTLASIEGLLHMFVFLLNLSCNTSVDTQC